MEMITAKGRRRRRKRSILIRTSRLFPWCAILWGTQNGPRTRAFLLGKALIPRSTDLSSEPMSLMMLSVNKRQQENLRLTTTSSAIVDDRTTALLRMERNVTTGTVTSSAAGLAVTIGLLYTLAMNGDSGDTSGSLMVENLEVASLNIIDATLPPLTASDVVSVAIGEAIAGIIGAAASFGFVSWRNTSRKKSKEGLRVSDVVADGDFLLTNAAAYPLFEAIGLSPLVASVSSTFLSIVPYGIVKVGAKKRRERRRAEDRLMDRLLEEQRRSKRINFPGVQIAKKAPVEEPAEILSMKEPTIEVDVVEVFSDTAKWLQYSVLIADFGGSLQLSGLSLPPGAESAIFGAIAAMSSQLYSDVLYTYFTLGGEAKRSMVRSRTLSDWFAVYASRLIYYAVLFGVYEAVQIPAKESVAAFLSGGVDACYGSNNFDACLNLYIQSNPPGASPEAQLRSFLTAAVSFWNNHGVQVW